MDIYDAKSQYFETGRIYNIQYIIYMIMNLYYTILAGLPGFARDSCSKIISISAFYF